MERDERILLAVTVILFSMLLIGGLLQTGQHYTDSDSNEVKFNKTVDCDTTKCIVSVEVTDLGNADKVELRYLDSILIGDRKDDEKVITFTSPGEKSTKVTGSVKMRIYKVNTQENSTDRELLSEFPATIKIEPDAGIIFQSNENGSVTVEVDRMWRAETVYINCDGGGGQLNEESLDEEGETYTCTQNQLGDDKIIVKAEYNGEVVVVSDYNIQYNL